jgi:hypothetical protein
MYPENQLLFQGLSFDEVQRLYGTEVTLVGKSIEDVLLDVHVAISDSAALVQEVLEGGAR